MTKARLYTMAASFAVGAAMWAIPAVSHAATVDCSNVKTGSSSYNKCKVTSDKSVWVKKSNKNSVTNLDIISQNSGDNKVKKNTNAADIDTGNTDVKKDVLTKVKNGDVAVEGCGCEMMVTGENNTTGSKSKNIVEISSSTKVGVSVSNSNSVSNTLIVDQNTGGNSMVGNTNGGDIKTGNATVNSETTTMINNGNVTVSL